MRRLVADGYAVMLGGDERQLRKIRDLLAEDGTLDVFLGENEDGVALHVSTRGPEGSLSYEGR